MNCTVLSHADAGDHVLIVSQVDDGATLRSDDEPMVHLRKSGFQY
jgi:flavin reductase (DIM6/NTAB) family NADH-FMN oxidoreductase RutF